MNVRLIQNGLLVTLIPVLATLLAKAFEGNPALQIGIAGLSMVLQLAVLWWSRRDLKKLTHPSREALERVGAAPMVMAYEPGKYRWDLRVVTALSGLSLLAPWGVLLARALPVTAVRADALLNGSQRVMLVTVLVIAAGTVSHLVWARMDQAAVIVNTGSDRRRYALRGFAEELDRPGGYARYLRGSVSENCRFRPRYETD